LVVALLVVALLVVAVLVVDLLVVALAGAFAATFAAFLLLTAARVFVLAWLGPGTSSSGAPGPCA
jgi:hypothetical protein